MCEKRDRERLMSKANCLNGLFFSRVYSEADPTDGYRILTDRLWPRGIAKDKAAIDDWAKQIAPTASLRQWFGHKPENFAPFKEQYIAELNANPDAPQFVAKCKQLLQDTDVTLLYGAKDEVHNHAVVLRDWILG